MGEGVSERVVTKAITAPATAFYAKGIGLEVPPQKQVSLRDWWASLLRCSYDRGTNKQGISYEPPKKNASTTHWNRTMGSPTEPIDDLEVHRRPMDDRTISGAVVLLGTVDGD